MKDRGEEEIGGFFLFFFENPLEEIRLKREEIKLTNNNNMQIAFGSPIQRNTNLFFFFFVEKKKKSKRYIDEMKYIHNVMRFHL